MSTFYVLCKAGSSFLFSSYCSFSFFELVSQSSQFLLRSSVDGHIFPPVSLSEESKRSLGRVQRSESCASPSPGEATGSWMKSSTWMDLIKNQPAYLNNQVTITVHMQGNLSNISFTNALQLSQSHSNCSCLQQKIIKYSIGLIPYFTQ